MKRQYVTATCAWKIHFYTQISVQIVPHSQKFLYKLEVAVSVYQR
jgi:hypothetical protein